MRELLVVYKSPWNTGFHLKGQEHLLLQSCLHFTALEQNLCQTNASRVFLYIILYAVHLLEISFDKRANQQAKQELSPTNHLSLIE